MSPRLDERAPDPFPTFERHGTPDDLNAIDDDQIAELVLVLNRAKDLPPSPHGLRPAAAEKIIYALAVHRSRRGKQLGEALLRALAVALDAETMCAEARGWLGLAPTSTAHRYERFLAAADLEVQQPGINPTQAAKMIGVDKKTITRWRKEPAFLRRVKNVKGLKGP